MLSYEVNNLKTPVFELWSCFCFACMWYTEIGYPTINYLSKWKTKAFLYLLKGYISYDHMNNYLQICTCCSASPCSQQRNLHIHTTCIHFYWNETLTCWLIIYTYRQIHPQLLQCYPRQLMKNNLHTNAYYTTSITWGSVNETRVNSFWTKK